MVERDAEQEHSTPSGEQDPGSATLSQTEAPGGAALPADPFATARQEVEEVLTLLAGRGIALGTHRALDFGCGAGQRTRALADHFDTCDGIDLAASLIDRARELAREDDRVRFHLPTSGDLHLFDDRSFDFVLALNLLAEMEPALRRAYIREFLRVLRPGGVVLFNLPEHKVPAEELPPQAWHARLTAIGSIPSPVSGGLFPIEVKLHNESPVRWPISAQLRVGGRWRTPTGGVVAIEGAAALIETAVNPGADYEVRAWFAAPPAHGEYELEVDLLQEQFGWFAERGSRPLKLPLSVVAEEATTGIAAAAASERVATDDPYAVARQDVAAMVRDAGGLMLEMIARDRSGPSMRSLDYVVARAATPTPGPTLSEKVDQEQVIYAWIRRALGYSGRSGGLSGELLAAGRQRSVRRGAALGVIGDRADLVGFRSSSRLRGVGRLSTLVRDGLRRALFEVFFRQTEFNRSTGELIRGHEAQLEALGATVRAQLDVQLDVGERVEALERRLARVEVSSAGLARRGEASERSGLADLDYASLAERVLGGREERRERLRRLLPRFAGRSEVIDAGCGRGEFLELLRDAGVSALGVERDESMVGWCRRFGLDVVHGEVLEFLRKCPEGSQGGIFGGYLVEHLERGEIVELVRLAFSRLRPGGVLVVEAVNPLCLLTYAGFYGDLTRVVPVPPLALQWLAESCGFVSVGVEYASPVPEERKLGLLPDLAGQEVEVEAFNRGVAAANELLFGFQEYVLTAHKPG